MKKNLYCSLVVIAMLIMLGCGEIPTAGATTTPASTPATQEIVSFSDPVLERMVKESMGKQDGDITLDEAAAVARLNLSNEWQRNLSNTESIQTIDGLEHFTHLEMLDLSYHNISDLTPLSNLKGLTVLSLNGNPSVDLSPLSGLSSLKLLAFSNCKATDYSALSALASLEYLSLDHSAITDVTPLKSLSALKHLYLADCSIDDYTPLTDISAALVDADFTIVSTLADLGFVKSDDSSQALYHNQDVSVRIHHSAWGAPPVEWETNCVWMSLQLKSGYTLDIGFYAEINAYVFQAVKDGEMRMNYVYDVRNDSLLLSQDDRDRFESVLREALEHTDTEDLLLAPITVFDDTISDIFHMTAEALYALPFEPPTLRNLGFEFFTDEEGNASYSYQEHEPHDMHISIFKSPWGQSRDGRSIEFYDDDINGFQLLVLYFADTQTYHMSLRKGDVAGNIDNYKAGEEGVITPDEETVRQVLSEAFGMEGTALYDKPVEYFEQVIQERFNISVEALYDLPLEN